MPAGPKPCEHAGVKPAHARALTVGATAAWLLPVGLVGYAAAQRARAAGLGPSSGPCSRSCSHPRSAWSAAWLIVRRVPTSPTGPALAWTGGAISFVMALDVLTQSEFYNVVPACGRSSPQSRPDCGPWTWRACSPCCSCSPTDGAPARVWRAVPLAYAGATVLTVAAMWGTHKVDGQVVGGPTREAHASCFWSAGSCWWRRCLVAAIVSLVLRYRSGDEVLRLRVRWLMLAGVAIVALLVAGWVMSIGFEVVLGVAYAPVLVAIVVLVPVAVTVAIVRHDLFDIDRLLSESTAWMLTLILSAATFGVVVLGVSEVVSRSSGLHLSAAAFVTALVLLPLHRYVSGAVARVVDRDRFVAVAQVERFAADVRAGRTDPGGDRRRAQGGARRSRTAAGPRRRRHLGRPLRRRQPGDGRPDPDVRRRRGRPDHAARTTPREPAAGWWHCRGRLRSRSRCAGCGSVCRASRARLIEATIAERRRLEHDLHDGAQQRIVATGMRLRLMQERPLPDPRVRRGRPIDHQGTCRRLLTSCGGSLKGSDRANSTTDWRQRWLR